MTTLGQQQEDIKAVRAALLIMKDKHIQRMRKIHLCNTFVFPLKVIKLRQK